MQFLPEEIYKYTVDHTEEESEVLKELDRDTNLNVLMPRMISGHLMGRVLAMISKMIRPKYILEVGTYTGYSAICFAEGLQDNGHIFTIDKNEEIEEMAQRYIERAGFQDRITRIQGVASEIIPTLNKKWDMVFLDADKKNYDLYYDQVFDNVNQGGFILVDNVLWSGKVVNTEGKKVDNDTRAIIDFNDRVHNDDRVENVLFPIRDGLMVLRKK
ncbi:O-methyltransferase [Marinigracilibium pacificum]|uniref:O-methyltransferase n=1 Tax=Marinigracilibium pacificum TaxID=2729599 RepID=A0A848IZ41_9BACT|nr:O-methyltransferase [Marinigracilibium pacificum]NMM49547.1 O-methyltransferase [Marinigracilibium pacificum]